jgi:hypothetical protein
MHKCPHCHQELKTFAFHCIRCRKEIGRVKVDGVLLALWWLDASGEPVEKVHVKTLMLGDTPVDAQSLEFVSPAQGSPYVLITLTNDEERPRRQDLVEFFRQATNPTQEWKIS